MSELTFTQAAIDKIKEIITDETDPTLKLRIFVQGGGCSGMQYGFTLDDVVTEDDIQHEQNGIVVLTDLMSYQYLVGAVVDYTEDLTGSAFKITNPNAQSTCGCGSSFSV